MFLHERLIKAMTQERRRYGFVLERQCSLAKHYLSYHTHGVAAYQQNIEKWSEVAKTREYLPESVENIFSSKMRVSVQIIEFYTLFNVHYIPSVASISMAR